MTQLRIDDPRNLDRTCSRARPSEAAPLAGALALRSVLGVVRLGSGFSRLPVSVASQPAVVMDVRSPRTLASATLSSVLIHGDRSVAASDHERHVCAERHVSASRGVVPP